MTREDFTEGSINQLIFEFWDGKITQDELRDRLVDFGSYDLAEFIIDTQGCGRFGDGYIHP